MDNLETILNRHKSDKAVKHRYHLAYEPFFEPKRLENINILEIGTFHGNSLRAFFEYFPNATLYTIDIFTRLKPSDVGDILDEDRVKWLKGDSGSPEIVESVNNVWPGVEFDFIIDDGGHWPQINEDTFSNFYPLLKKGGTYFIEDVWAVHDMTEQQLKHRWLQEFSEKYSMEKSLSFINTVKDSGALVEVFDGRKSAHPDSYIVKATK